MALRKRVDYLKHIGQGTKIWSKRVFVDIGMPSIFDVSLIVGNVIFYRGFPVILGQYDGMTSMAIVDYATGYVFDHSLWPGLYPPYIRKGAVAAVIDQVEKWNKTMWDGWEYLVKQHGHAVWATETDVAYVRACRLTKEIDCG